VFYETEKNDHGLKFNPYKSVVIPRPIGWISTLSRSGVVNLAPFSQFNNLGYDPPYVMFSAGSDVQNGERKDTVVNAIETGEFVCNMATWDLREQVNITAQAVPPEVDEAKLAGLEMVPSRLIKPPRVAASPVHLECHFYQAVVLPGHSIDNIHHVVIGKVVGVHIKDEALTADGRIDVKKIRPIARLGYMDYTFVDTIFSMAPDGPDAERLRSGLIGQAKGKRGVASTAQAAE
jgi:flavin reductase (DIM6/NTAB) family NADH-FMN oxidoreductase RutF